VSFIGSARLSWSWRARQLRLSKELFSCQRLRRFLICARNAPFWVHILMILQALAIERAAATRTAERVLH
jgi:hypothetical protein